MPKLELKFLGVFSVSHDSATVSSFESNKVRALLAYLAVEAGRPHARDTLAVLLWPDWPDSSARSNLRYALSDLRKTIGDRGADPMEERVEAAGWDVAGGDVSGHALTCELN